MKLGLLRKHRLKASKASNMNSLKSNPLVTADVYGAGCDFTTNGAPIRNLC